MHETFVGFDSAWGGRKPGGIVWAAFADGQIVSHPEPEPADFESAAGIVEKLKAASDYLLVAVDQPTLVPNLKGARPVERVAASLVSRLRSGVQPANRGKPVFEQGAPIWRFLDQIGGQQDPLTARNARQGLYLVEVYPVLALSVIEPLIMKRRQAARYNLGNRKKFRLDDWKLVAEAVARDTAAFGLPRLSQWTMSAAECAAPKKRDQDLLDAVICLIAALRWRRAPHGCVSMIGDLKSGYMVTPVSAETHDILFHAAKKRGVNYRQPAPPA